MNSPEFFSPENFGSTWGLKISISMHPKGVLQVFIGYWPNLSNKNIFHPFLPEACENLPQRGKIFVEINLKKQLVPIPPFVKGVRGIFRYILLAKNHIPYLTARYFVLLLFLQILRP